mmetsp:Transcript_11219/g.50842  ORF Transcript_11219/g.50842 Transcript_11219/m.50842 type:complete len:325 (-) Transcript_11219:63-1037(-)
MCWSWEAGAGEGHPMVPAAVEEGLFCTLRAKRCRRVPSLSPSVTAVSAPIPVPPPAMVAPAALMAWWQMVGRVVSVLAGKAGQAAPRMQVDPELRPMQVEAVVAPLTQGRQQMKSALVITMQVTAAWALNRPYLVPPFIMAAAAAAAPLAATTAMEDWAAVGEEKTAQTLVIQVRHSQGAEVVAPVVVCIMGGQAAPAWSSYATKKPPATTKAAPRTTTTTGRTASRARPARRGCPTPLTSAYAPGTTTAGLTAACTRAPRALRVQPDPRVTPSRVATRRRAHLDHHRLHRLRRRHRLLPPPKTRRRRPRRPAMRSSATSKTRG